VIFLLGAAMLVTALGEGRWSAALRRNDPLADGAARFPVRVTAMPLLTLLVGARHPPPPADGWLRPAGPTFSRHHLSLLIVNPGRTAWVASLKPLMTRRGLLIDRCWP
jgi:hypothetical protein